MEKLRSVRIFGIAVFDLTLAVAGTVIIMVLCRHFHKYNGKKPPLINFIIAGILLAVPIGIFVHVLFGTDTTLNYRLGLSNKPKTKSK